MIHALRQKPACLDSYAKLNPSFVSVKENFTSVAGYSTPPSMGVWLRNSSWISGQRSISFPTCSAKSGSAKTASDWSMCPSIRRIVWSTSKAPKVGWADMVCTLDRCWSHESLKLKIAPNHDTFSHHGFPSWISERTWIEIRKQPTSWSNKPWDDDFIFECMQLAARHALRTRTWTVIGAIDHAAIFMFPRDDMREIYPLYCPNKQACSPTNREWAALQPFIGDPLGTWHTGIY